MCGTLEFASPAFWSGQQQKTWTKYTETDLAFSNYKCWNSKLNLRKLKVWKEVFITEVGLCTLAKVFLKQPGEKKVCWKKIAMFSVLVLIQVIRTFYGLKIKVVGIFFLFIFTSVDIWHAQDVFCHAAFVCQNVLFLSLYLKSELLSYLG